MFNLNEAPNIVLAKISSQKTARGCGMFWSVLCCIPSFGSTIGSCDDRKGNDWIGCCFPRSVSLESDSGLRALIDTLNTLKFTKQTNLDINLDDQKMRREFIEWQVKETIRLLEQVTKENTIEGSYKTTLSEALTIIKSRATAEEQHSIVLATEKTPLTGHDVYVPRYGLTAQQ